MKLIIALLGLFFFTLILKGNNDSLRLKQVKQIKPDRQGEIQISSLSSNSLSEYIDQAWDVSWKRFYLSNTQLFYDYLTSYKDGMELAHLPTADEVSRQYPNPYGYGTGMEDCMISAGVMLSMIVDQYVATKNKELRKYAYYVFQGIRRCATAHGVKGFLARGVCREDLKSIYINSSRDQYTHAVYGLWCYSNSCLCDLETQLEIGKILSAIADRMTRNVTPENNYDFLRADNTHDTRGISRMWNVKGHEAARLPMIYAAAWNSTGKQEYYDLYRKYIVPAVEQSFVFEQWQPTYAFLQMQCSLELLESLEKDQELKDKMHVIMERVSNLCAKRAFKADSTGHTIDLTMLGSDWRNGYGLNPKREYRKVWYCIRESGEAIISQLIFNRGDLSSEQKNLLTSAIVRLDFDHVSSSGIFYLQAAYWKAYKLGMFRKEIK